MKLGEYQSKNGCGEPWDNGQWIDTPVEPPNKLLPCPFCGGEAMPFVPGDAPANEPPHWIACSKCEADGPPFYLVCDVVKAWNKRVNITPVLENYKKENEIIFHENCAIKKELKKLEAKNEKLKDFLKRVRDDADVYRYESHYCTARKMLEAIHQRLNDLFKENGLLKNKI